MLGYECRRRSGDNSLSRSPGHELIFEECLCFTGIRAAIQHCSCERAVAYTSRLSNSLPGVRGYWHERGFWEVVGAELYQDTFTVLCFKDIRLDVIVLLNVEALNFLPIHRRLPTISVEVPVVRW
jgi:hypothetical protein